MTEHFEFEDNGRVFVCTSERLSRTSSETWWWFRVSVEQNARYAPFRTTASDTESSVQRDVVGFYDALLARRAEPPVSRWQRGAGRPANSALNGTGAAASAAPGDGAASSVG